VTDEPIITDGMPTQIPDADPSETAEWLEALDAVVAHHGRDRARYLLLKVMERARNSQVGLPALRSSDYINTIPPDREPAFPGDEAIEHRIRALIRWNAAVMVTRANRPEVGVGGHIASYASAADLYEVGFNHFFRGRGAAEDPRAGDQLFVQGHASPGIYARAFLEGRLTEEQLDLFRQETKRTSDGRGPLSSYPHPRLMPDFWEFPTVSMGLGPINSIYQARFNRYLAHRGFADTSDATVWAFVGDGEMDEPEAQGALSVAGREELDNLVWVVNCNLQRLDGPTRGNGKIIQELESIFRGAGWNVIKVVWGRKWDRLLDFDHQGELVKRMNETPDGQFQTYTTKDGAYIREHFFNSPELQRILAESGFTEEDLPLLDRGGHDYRKNYAAFEAAQRHRGQPTVILAQTIKGWTLGPDFESRNATHQMKKLTQRALKKFRDRLELDISDAQLEGDLPPYHHPGADSEEVQYLQERRRELGGYLPQRRVQARGVDLPASDSFSELKRGSGTSEVATTMAAVRQLRELLKHPDLGPRIVPIIPDEARTFGMDALFREIKIYAPGGQRYEPVDQEMLLAYIESQDGQILHEGITESGSMASFHAAGTSYATWGEPLLPVYVFYSMFGFQRVGDLIWSAADQRTRGFLFGATAGRTTLTGEGLQHADGHSLLLAATNPAVETYDASFAYELAVYLEDGMRRMLPHDGHDGEDVMYYLTMYNEPVVQPPMPDHVSEDDVRAGLYRFADAPEGLAHRVRLLTSGSVMPETRRAAELLAADWGVGAEVWSAPGWVGLHREGLQAEEHNLLNPSDDPRVPLVTRLLGDEPVATVGVTDYQQTVPRLIGRWVPGTFLTLGTDGFGLSDTRTAARRWFRVDAEHTVIAALTALARDGAIKHQTVSEAIDRYGIDPALTPVTGVDV